MDKHSELFGLNPTAGKAGNYTRIGKRYQKLTGQNMSNAITQKNIKTCDIMGPDIQNVIEAKNFVDENHK